MFKIYKGDDVVVEGASPLEIKGIGANKDVAKGTYQAVRVEDDKESERVDIPAFKTLPIKVTGVTVKPASVELDIGKTQQLTPTIAPANATNKKVTYASKEQGIASVDDKGLITAKVAGSTEIVVTTDDGSKKATCKVTVKEPVVNVTGVTLSPNNMAGEAGKASNRQLTPTIVPENATNQKVTYAVAPSTDGLTINASGVLAWTADVPAGEYTVTVTTEDGKKTDTSKLVLSEPVVNVTGVTIAPKAVDLEIGDTQQLSATVAPANADDKTVTYASKAQGVASVDGKGLVTAKAAGKAEIVVTTKDGDKKDTCVVTVVEPEPEPEPEPKEGE